MTQPPPPPPNQPPNQPPQQGFGAPQNPPPGGFGAPQTPPPGGYGAPQQPQPPQQGPGYSYPQAPQPPQTPPPAPPQGQPTPPPPPQGPGYGYPQTPGTPPPTQPGYGPPTPPPTQPGYGYPGQQPQGPYGYPQPQTVSMQPQAPQGGGKKSNSQLVIIVAAVAAIALIVGGGVWYASSSGKDDDSKNTSGSTSGGSDGGEEGGDSGSTGGAAKEKVPANTSAKVLFQLPAPEIKSEDEIDSVAGSWLTESVYAKAGINKIVGYEPGSGSEKWTLDLPGQTCAGSPEITGDGVAAVVTEAAKRGSDNKHELCTQILAFNVNTGKKLWTKSVDISGTTIAFDEISISGSTVAAGGGYNGGAAFDVKSGKVLWQPKVSTCEDVGYAGGDQLVAVRKCGTYDNEKYQVQLLDPKSGSVKWSYKLPDGIDNAKVISTKPVVFGVDSGEITASGVTDVFSLDESGKLRTKITLADGKYEHDCGVNKVHDCKGITVGNDKLYVPTKSHDGGGDYSQTNEIISFSLDTGKTTGDRIDAGDDYEIRPIRMDGGNILAYKDGPYDKGAQVVSVDGKSLKATKLLETPASETVLDAISGMVPDTCEMLYSDGRLFMGKDLVSKPYDADEKEYTALGFGAE
ncbi:PQQ-binding-like beta-propeller repeat protein [Streptomyces sp. NPDC059785]|uniref:outer membrane protein assembly factor BamB family protein n=1 Tax=unclassified Streptomyces TaxID=2593676 RepID=UPI00364691FD